MMKLFERSVAAVVMKKKIISELPLKVSTITSSYHSHHSKIQSTITHFEQFVRERCKSGNLGIEEAKGLFDNAIQMRPSPSILLFTQLLGAICKLRQYPTVITMFKAMESKGIKPDLVTFSTLINCFCQMGKVDFGFAVVGNIFKSGFEPNIVIFNTLLKGLFKENRVKDAMKLFNKITKIGYTCDDFTYGTMIDGLCKTGNVDQAFKLLQDMEKRGTKHNHLQRFDGWILFTQPNGGGSKNVSFNGCQGL
ncbi:hypothetical protein GIB67_035973 [Kingdonia uniflora]|uniref:Pentatricopeptide repeat-containing protein n=1 Tax=Kingdonia uniflora TaxID=39325 RepID=A0A7J7N191_9MAGN|nr:hypothetical protein GIB67_035973 [Kingdonia uniflora]